MYKRGSIHFGFKKILLIAVLLFFAVFCYFVSKEEPVSYMTVTPLPHDIQKKVYATGTISSAKMVDVGAQVSGQILKLYVKRGDEVKKGDILCEIDPKIQINALKTAEASIAMIDAQIVAKEAQIHKLELEYSRQKRLVKIDATSKQSLEAAYADYIVAKASLEELKASRVKAQLAVEDAKTNLSYNTIHAPMDGTVYALVVSEGQTVNSAQTTPTILRLANLDEMKIKTEISEADVVNVKKGMDCTFTVLGLPYNTFYGKLDSISPAPSSYESSTSSSSSSSQSSSTAIYYNSDIITRNEERILKIDMTADVVINVADKKHVLSLPLSALRSTYADTAKVYVLDEQNLVQEKTIKTGLKDDQYIEIVEGLADNDRIVIGDDVKTAEMQAQMSHNSRRRGPF